MAARAEYVAGAWWRRRRIAATGRGYDPGQHVGREAICEANLGGANRRAAVLAEPYAFASLPSLHRGSHAFTSVLRFAAEGLKRHPFGSPPARASLGWLGAPAASRRPPGGCASPCRTLLAPAGHYGVRGAEERKIGLSPVRRAPRSALQYQIILSACPQYHVQPRIARALAAHACCGSLLPSGARSTKPRSSRKQCEQWIPNR